MDFSHFQEFQPCSRQVPIDESMYQSAISGEEPLAAAVRKVDILQVLLWAHSDLWRHSKLSAHIWRAGFFKWKNVQSNVYTNYCIYWIQE